MKFLPPIMSKVPLIRWSKKNWYVQSAHTLVRPVALAPMRAALLHFKLFDDITERCAIELNRREYPLGAREYDVLTLALNSVANGSFFDPRWSVRYERPEQLVALGLMNATDPFGELPS